MKAARLSFVRVGTARLTSHHDVRRSLGGATNRRYQSIGAMKLLGAPTSAGVTNSEAGRERRSIA